MTTKKSIIQPPSSVNFLNYNEQLASLSKYINLFVIYKVKPNLDLFFEFMYLFVILYLF